MTDRRDVHDDPIKPSPSNPSKEDTLSGTSTQHDSNMVDLTATYRTLIAANHILHNHQVVDAYGHVSVRNPNNASTFFLSGYLAPALVSSRSDIVEYLVSDASAVDPSAGKGYSEKFIHSEVLKAFPNINAVIHSHSEAVLPYTVSGVANEPVFHMAGFLGGEVPNFDIETVYQANDTHDMLISNTRLGGALASYFRSSNSSSNSSDPHYTAVLMRGHGFTTLGSSVEEAVYRALYAHTNAGVQTNAILLNRAMGLPQGVQYLNSQERVDCRKMNEGTQDKPWKLWVREIEVNSLYVNKEGAPDAP